MHTRIIQIGAPRASEQRKFDPVAFWTKTIVLFALLAVGCVWLVIG